MNDNTLTGITDFYELSFAFPRPSFGFQLLIIVAPVLSLKNATE